ncbi:MAG: RsmE family RNA methyltransferase [Acidimicrobiales bacterium]
MTLEGPAARHAAAHVFVDDLGAPSLSAEDRHHLSRSLRLRAGQAVTACDGAGAWRECSFTDASGLSPAGPVVMEERRVPSIGIGVAVGKGGRTDWAVSRLTEAGVDWIVPMTCERSAVLPAGQAAGRVLDRLRRVSVQAAMQSRRAFLPRIGWEQTPAPTFAPVPTFGELVPRLGDGACMAEPGGAPPSLERPFVLIGPEGGWAAGERSSGLAAVSLGDGVYRSEAAAVVAGALLAALRCGLVAPAPS